VPVDVVIKELDDGRLHHFRASRVNACLMPCIFSTCIFYSCSCQHCVQT